MPLHAINYTIKSVLIENLSGYFAIEANRALTSTYITQAHKLIKTHIKYQFKNLSQLMVKIQALKFSIDKSKHKNKT